MKIPNHIVVKVKGLYNETIQYGSLKLDSYQGDTAIADEEGVMTYNPNNIIKICGEVVEVPTKLSGGLLIEKYPGRPRPEAYYSFEQCRGTEYKNLPNSRTISEEEYVKRNKKAYKCGVFEFEYLTLSDVDNEVQKGDKAYFHYHSLCADNFLGKDEEGFDLYKVAYDQMFCVVRGIEQITSDAFSDLFTTIFSPLPVVIEYSILPICGHILLQPYYGDDYIPEEVGGVTMQVKKSGSIITDVSEKPRHLEATVAHVGKMIGFETVNVVPGDRVIYTPHSDFENEIEGQKYYVCKLWDLICKNNNDMKEPLGAWVEITPDPAEKLTAMGIILPGNQNKTSGVGTIKSIGPDVTEVSVGDRVQYDNKVFHLQKIEGSDFVKEGDIYGILTN